jgi:hypothetical protein
MHLNDPRPVARSIDSLSSLHDFLARGEEAAVLRAIQSGAFEQVLPGLQRSSGCSHGCKIHLEGDVAVHTAKASANLVSFASGEPQVEIDAIDMLAVLMHDIEKVNTRVEDAEGGASFPGHEAAAAARVPTIARALGLSTSQEQKLHFLVAEHGVVHSLPYLPEAKQRELFSSPHWRNLALLQKADASACFLNEDGSLHLPVYWQTFMELASRYSAR